MFTKLKAKFKSKFQEFAKDEKGATVIEYVIIAAIVGVGLIAVMNTLRTNLNNKLTTIATRVSEAGIK